MGKIRLLSLVLCAAVLMPVFTSCKAGNKGSSVVKEDDPWYESTKFELVFDRKKGEDGCDSFISVSNDRIFSCTM